MQNNLYLIIANAYPSSCSPNKAVFVKKFVESLLANYTSNLLMVVPRPIHRFFCRHKKINSNFIQKGGIIISPLYISFLPVSRFFPKRIGNCLMVLTYWLYFISVKFSIRKYKGRIKGGYAHFIFPSGLALSKISRDFGISSVVYSGESSFDNLALFYNKFIVNHLPNINLIYASNSYRRSELNRLGIWAKDKIHLQVNSTDLSLFFPRDRKKSRALLNINENIFVVAYLGAMNYRKGAFRLHEALKTVDGVKAMYIGEGDYTKVSDSAIFSGTLPQELIPTYLSSADIFCLPTLAEGSCNAVIEAIACGLPIITSEGEYMDDLVSNDISIRVNPMDIDQIRAAIVVLRDNTKLRKQFSDNCMRYRYKFDLISRTSIIFEAIQNANK